MVKITHFSIKKKVFFLVDMQQSRSLQQSSGDCCCIHAAVAILRFNLPSTLDNPEKSNK